MWRLAFIVSVVFVSCGEDMNEVELENPKEICMKADSLDATFLGVQSKYDSINGHCTVTIIARHMNNKEVMDSVCHVLSAITDPIDNYVGFLNGTIVPLAKGHTTIVFSDHKDFYEKEFDKLIVHLAQFNFTSELAEFDYYFSFEENSDCENRNKINELRMTCVSIAQELVLDFKSKFEGLSE